MGKTEADFLEEELLETFGEKENEEEEPATEGRREYTDLRPGLEERNEHISCHASALALAMTDEVCRKAQM